MNLTLPLFDASPSAAPAAEPPTPAAGAALAATPSDSAESAEPGQGQTGAQALALLLHCGAAAEAPSICHTDRTTTTQPGLTQHWLDTRPAALLPPPDPVRLHPSLWRASQIGGGQRRTTPSGHAALDAELPGGGWPHAELTELLLPQPGIGELRLLVPALAMVGRAGQGGGQPTSQSIVNPCVMLFDPPALLSAWALAQQGLSSRHWLLVHARAGQGGAAARSSGLAADAGATAPSASSPPRIPPRGPQRLAPLLPAADLLWALEQALRSGHLGAVLAWLPTALRADALRRLQLAAQSHDGPVFLFRHAQARSRPSAAPLRLLLQPAGVDSLSVRLLKRRGPPLAQALMLVLPAVLSPRQQAQALARQALQGAHHSAGRASATLASDAAQANAALATAGGSSGYGGSGGRGGGHRRHPTAWP